MENDNFQPTLGTFTHNAHYFFYNHCILDLYSDNLIVVPLLNLKILLISSSDIVDKIVIFKREEMSRSKA